MINEMEEKRNSINPELMGEKDDKMSKALLVTMTSHDSGMINYAYLLKIGMTLRGTSTFEKMQILHTFLFLEMTRGEIFDFTFILQNLLDKSMASALNVAQKDNGDTSEDKS